jgi:hypothetical protein
MFWYDSTVPLPGAPTALPLPMLLKCGYAWERNAEFMAQPDSLHGCGHSTTGPHSASVSRGRGCGPIRSGMQQCRLDVPWLPLGS